MKVTHDPGADYTGLFTFDPILENAASFGVQSGQNAAIVHTHLDWSFDGQLTDFATVNPIMGMSVADMAARLAEQNSVLAVSWDPMSADFLDPAAYSTPGAARVGLQEIIDGTHDGFIQQVAQQVKALDRPLMLNLFGEADSNSLFAYGAGGDSSEFAVADATGHYGDPTMLDGPERIRDAYRHVVDIFNEEGVQNATWFMYTAGGFGIDVDMIAPELFYPGDDYVDWVGKSLYLNDPSQLDAWLKPGYDAWARVSDNPFFIPEMGIFSGTAASTAAMLEEMSGYDRLGAFTWADFGGLTEDWGVPRLGSNGEWEALGAASGIAGTVRVAESGTGSSDGTGSGADGGAGTDDGTGGPARFVGTAAGDTLTGTAGGDTLEGLAGDDLYMVDNAGDAVIEALGGGFDTVLASVSHRLAANVEALMLDGAGPLAGTGNALDNMIFGTAGANHLRGLGGDDMLSGGGGSDTLEGGAGDDVYILSSGAELVIETASGGTDTVVTSVSVSLGRHVETALVDSADGLAIRGNGLANVLLGGVGGDKLTGARGDDMLQGEDGADRLYGGVGADTIDGGNGADFLTGGGGSDVLLGGSGHDRMWIGEGDDYIEGGLGRDTFIFRGSSGDSVIADFEAGTDVLDLSATGFSGMAELQSASYAAGGDLLILIGSASLYLMGTDMADLQASDVIF